MSSDHEFWPNGARLAVTVSMQFEAGGQPLSGAGGPITEPIMEGYPGLGQNSFYEYGAREGVPRILDLLDRHEIPMTPFMIGDAVRRHPDVAAEIVRIASFDFPGFSPADYEQQLGDGFDQLYAEGATRRRISGPQERHRAVDPRPRRHRRRVDRGPAPVSGFPGRSR